MLKRLIGPIPEWIRSDNPILRYALGTQEVNAGSRSRLRRVSSVVLLSVLMLAAGYLIANARLDVDVLDLPLSQMLFEVVFWPVFALQIVIQIMVIMLTINIVSNEKQRQTWDSLKVTSGGAGLTLRAWWSSVLFYRVRPLMVLLVFARLVLMLSLLRDLTAFGGEYLNYLTIGITPDVSPPVAVVLLAVTLTATLMLPFTAAGMDAAIGLYIATFVHQRTFVVLMQFTMAIIRVLIIVGVLLAVTQVRENSLPLSTRDEIIWLIIFAFAVVGDWGLSLLFLGFYGQMVWSNVPYGILIGLAMLIFVMMQAAMADGVLLLAARRAERSE